MQTVANVLDFVVAVITITIQYPHIDVLVYCVRVRACAYMRACVKHLAKNWVQMRVLVYNRECMLQINHIVVNLTII